MLNICYPRSIWFDIIDDLCAVWEEPEIMQSLSKHLVIFTPDAFPDCFAWSVYGLGCVLEMAVQRCKTAMSSDQSTKGRLMASYYLELVAAVERMIAFGYTGSSQVLLKELLEPLCATWSLQLASTPMLHSSIIDLSDGLKNVTLNPEKWPCNGEGIPAMASFCAQTRSYSEGFAMVSDLVLMGHFEMDAFNAFIA